MCNAISTSRKDKERAMENPFGCFLSFCCENKKEFKSNKV